MKTKRTVRNLFVVTAAVLAATFAAGMGTAHADLTGPKPPKKEPMVVVVNIPFVGPVTIGLS